ncbi:MAG: hypothetical protein J6Y71_04485 [Ruminococcus sp.]|nr:hypothetical protein [Ruminococcus sp.]
MKIDGKYYSEPEVQAYITKLNRLVSDLTELLALSVNELHKLGYEDCFSCKNKGSCAYKNDCNYRWEHADKAERLINDLS